MHYLLQPGPTLPDRFAHLIGGLCFYLGAVFTRDRSTASLTLLVQARLQRLSARFAALVARVEAGTLRPARARATVQASQMRRVGSLGGMPRAFGWLCRLMPEGNLYAGMLEEQIHSDAELVALLAKAPQAGRLLRPVLRMMGRPVPESLRIPKLPQARAVRPEPVATPGTPYREQPPGSHYPASIWPTRMQWERAGRRLARQAVRRISPQ